MDKDEMNSLLAELEALVGTTVESTSLLSPSSLRKTMKNIPRIIDLSFRLTKAVIEKLDELESK